MRQKDASKQVSVALGDNTATVVSDMIDLEQTTPFPVTRQVMVQLSTPDGMLLANTKNINAVLQHSDDNNASNLVNIPELANPVLRATGNAAGKAPAKSINVALPPGVKRYLAVSATGEAAGGNSAASKLTVALLF